MPGSQGKFIWRELMTSDAEAAKTFYAAVVGWAMHDVQQPRTTYTMLNVGDFGVGGIMAIPDEAAKAGMRPIWLGYIHVDDVDAAAKRIEEEGGAIHHAPDDLPGYGRFAMVADPHGAAFYIMTPTGADRTPPRSDTPGMPGWNGLYGGDLDGDWDFYASLFGWEKAHAVDLGPMGTYQLLSIDGVQAGGMMTKPAQIARPTWVYYFSTDDVHAAAGRVTANGGQVVNGPNEVPGGSWVVQCLDPQGALFAMVQANR